jgi:hypothetical protein
VAGHRLNGSRWRRRASPRPSPKLQHIERGRTRARDVLVGCRGG